MTRKRRKYKNVTMTDFMHIKWLITTKKEMGIKKYVAPISKITERTPRVIRLIDQSTTFEDYKENVRKIGERYKRAKEEQAQKQLLNNNMPEQMSLLNEKAEKMIPKEETVQVLGVDPKLLQELNKNLKQLNNTMEKLLTNKEARKNFITKIFQSR